MKKIIFLVLVFAFQISFSQGNVETKISESEGLDTVVNSSLVEVKPEYPGGIQEFYKFIGRNFNTPEAKEFKGGKVLVQFVVDLDGSITDIKVLKDAGFGTKEEAIRVLQKTPKWKPAEQNGRFVKCMYMLPITLQSP